MEVAGEENLIHTSQCVGVGLIKFLSILENVFLRSSLRAQKAKCAITGESPISSEYAQISG